CMSYNRGCARPGERLGCRTYNAARETWDRNDPPRARIASGGHGSAVMPLEGELHHRLERALSVGDDHGTRGTRLLEDAQRFCARVRRLIARGLLPADTDAAPLETACHALQLPLRASKSSPTGKLGRTNLRERA